MTEEFLVAVAPLLRTQRQSIVLAGEWLRFAAPGSHNYATWKPPEGQWKLGALETAVAVHGSFLRLIDHPSAWWGLQIVALRIGAQNQLALSCPLRLFNSVLEHNRELAEVTPNAPLTLELRWSTDPLGLAGTQPPAA